MASPTTKRSASDGRDQAFDPRAWQLWGKADPARAGQGRPDWHPLLCHVLDVVACAERLLVHVREDRWRALAAPLGLNKEEALPWLLFFVALHDLGKATPPFQIKVESRRDALVLLGLDFPVRDEPHGNLSVPLATSVLTGLGVSPALARWVARAVGAHHGEFTALGHLARSLEAKKGALFPVLAGKAPLWAELRVHLVDALAEVCGIIAGAPRPALPASSVDLHAWVADLAGLTTVTDWLGSNADVFEYVPPPESPQQYYFDVARERAERAVTSAGWRPPPRSSGRTFLQLFGRTPWPLHIAVEELLPSLRAPSLVIVEAPMGEGKTEAALSIFDALSARGATGLYFALPTQATSNQIFGRVERFFRSAFPGEAHGLHLVHGDAGLSDAYEALQRRAWSFRAIGDVAGRTGDLGPIADVWFARGKRALLAPIGVGTVDQALLGVLPVRHGFLRLHGLAGKVVVIDEAHAYDTYTSELLDRLLSWLSALRATVVLLSATLPSARRDALLRAYGGASPPRSSYPRITVASEGNAASITFQPRRAPVPVALAWKALAELPSELGQVLSGGGCAVWIVNTVRTAQRTYRDLLRLQEEGSLPRDLAIDLLHARFPYDARAARERLAEERFGPGEDKRPRSALLVGTQVLEQSLDLDFDLMITELAPVDLILQRAGRLHRHDRKQQRPAAVRRPALWLLRPEGETRPNGPTFGSSAYVYAEAILLRTWLALRARSEVLLPVDIEPLIEAVYSQSHEAPPEIAARLSELDRAHREETRSESNQARSIDLPPPGGDDPFRDLASLKDVEDPAMHPGLRAVTRLGDPSVEIIPFQKQGGRTVLAGAPEVAIDLSSRDPLPRNVVIAAARQSISIQRRDVVLALAAQPVPATFEASGHLRFHRAVLFDEQKQATIAGTHLVLDTNLGLVVGSLDDRRDTRRERPDDTQ